MRGRGLFQGVELVTDRTTKAPAAAYREAVTAACFERGLHLNIVQFPGSGSILHLAPPLTATDPELDSALSILDHALTIRRAEQAGRMTAGVPRPEQRAHLARCSDATGAGGAPAAAPPE
ncbi:hypothetical protein [Streptomyces sp. NPDC127197]|uniref:hypothetical protein n=1 Tax=Streptomyces sp. NPDC127197 TaxID=3345388 RepID=UPI00363A4EF8